MKFPCPNKMSLGMKTALAWHQEQLLLARKHWDQKNRRHVAIGHIPSTPPTLISHLVHNVENPETTATNTTHQSLSPSPSSLSPSQNPFAPSTWRHLASTVKKPRRWQVDLPLPSDKVVKIPLQFRRPIPIVEEHAAQGMGVRGRGRRGRGQARSERPVLFTTACVSKGQILTRAQRTRRLASRLITDNPIPIAAIAGVRVQLRGAAYVPFNILNEQGVETPASLCQGTPRSP
jgi:hypothetical protein